MNVTRYSSPVATITTLDCTWLASSWHGGCMTFTEAIPGRFAGYAFCDKRTVENIDAVGAPIGAALLTRCFVDFRQR